MSHKHRSPHGMLWVACILIVQGGGLAAFAQSIPWRNGPKALPSMAAADMALTLEGVPRSADGSLHVVVQLEQAADAKVCSDWRAEGVELLRSVGGNAYFAKVRPGPDGQIKLNGKTGLVQISPVLIDWKLHPAIAAGELPEWTRVYTPETGSPGIAVYAVFHSDVNLEDEAAPLVATFDGVIRDRMPSIRALVLELPEDQITGLASSDIVQWIEPALPPLDVTNDEARATTQIDTVQASPYDLDGSGISVMVYDGGVARSTHVDFEGRLIVGDSANTILHATHVAGTIGGGGVAEPDYKGMAPGVTLLSYGFQMTGSGGLYTNPGDMEADYRRAMGEGAVISNNSIGSNVEANGLNCDWQGDYGTTASLIDGIVQGALGNPFRVIWAAGNERTGSRCDVEGYGDFYSVPPPCAAKNQISVGAIDSDDPMVVASFSSWGPTDDGRLKPDICAPGDQSDQDWGITSCSDASDTAYRSMTGTSMAAPVVCGGAALMLQDFKVLFPGQLLPRNSTLKVILAQTAFDMGETGPDYKYGYGFVQFEDAILFQRSAAFAEDSVAHGETSVRTVTVESGDPELKVTLAWDDVPGVPNTIPSLVNDLDLVVRDPNGVQHYPWTLDPLDPSAPAVRAQADHLNNIEQVFVENPIAGVWTIEVVGTDVPEGPQSFSLAGDGILNVVTFFTLEEPLPDLVPSGEPFTWDLGLVSYNDAAIPGTAAVHFRVDGGEWQTVPMTTVSPGHHAFTLPAQQCDSFVEYYFSVETEGLGVVTDPASAPAELHSYQIGVWAPVLTDSFETDLGWTVEAGAYSGNWERGDPEEVTNQGVITQPEDDHTPDDGTLCYVTGAAAGYSPSFFDVDGGPSHLISPVFDLSGTDAVVEYWRWFHISMQMDDYLIVEVTNNGTDWVVAEQVVRSASEWIHAKWRVSQFVEPTETVRVRFTVYDRDPGSLMEALVDDFTLAKLSCEDALAGDIDADGDVDFDDLDLFVDVLVGTNLDPEQITRSDLNDDEIADGRDIADFVAVLLAS